MTSPLPIDRLAVEAGVLLWFLLLWFLYTAVFDEERRGAI